MNAEKRKVSTDALETLGTIIEDGGRDAIHLAVEPVIAGERLMPGENIGLDEGKAYNNSRGDIVKFVGIVDPFLKAPVEPGQKFWLVVYPRQITSLRHVWSHPDFEESTPEPVAQSLQERSKEWIEDWALTIPLAYDVVMNGAADWVDSKQKGEWGEYLCFGGLLEGESVPDEFWIHYEIVTGKQVLESHRGSFFTCSC